jgi:prepilin-type N-terminal cleavage/methylation domain-containing protein
LGPLIFTIQQNQCDKRNEVNALLNSRRGFTLMELIVVMAVLAILVTIAVPYFKDYAGKARLARLSYDMRLVEDACHMYHEDHSVWPVEPDLVNPVGNVLNYARKVFAPEELSALGDLYRINLGLLKDYVRLRSNDRDFYLLLESVVAFDDGVAFN